MGLMLAVCASVSSVNASGFDASISPPKFELKAKPGQKLRQVVHITNSGQAVSEYFVKSIDWEFTKNGDVKFNEGPPKATSCRPWVHIERHSIRVPLHIARPYRFEVHVPETAPSGQCRFALVFGPNPKKVAPAMVQGMKIPVVGRIAVIVYVTVGDAKAKLKLLKLEKRKVNGKLLPVAVIKNSGDAHGRLFGTLTAKGVGKKKLELTADQVPILPGRTEVIPLRPVDWSSGEAKPADFSLKPPVQIRGKLEWDGGVLKLDRLLP